MLWYKRSLIVWTSSCGTDSPLHIGSAGPELQPHAAAEKFRFDRQYMKIDRKLCFVCSYDYSTDTEWAAAAPNISDSDIHSKPSLDSLDLSPIPTATTTTALDLDSIFMYNDPTGIICGHSNSTPEKNQKNRQTMIFSPTFSIYEPESLI